MAVVFVTGGSGFVGRTLVRTLAERGDEVRGLARSAAASDAVRVAGGLPIQGDLNDAGALRRGIEGADLVVHAAARVKSPPKDTVGWWRANVDGTQAVLDAARDTGVPTFVHVSTIRVVDGDGRDVVDADESWSYPSEPKGLYAATKIEAERRVLAAAGPTLRTVAVRPCWVWGPGDPIFRRIVELARRGRFRWIGASVPVSTTQVDNVVEGVLLAADKGASGQAYFLTDGPPIDSRVFMRALLGTQGMTVSDKQMSYRTARTTATIAEFAWSVLRLSSDVLLDVDSVETTVRPMTVRDDKARKELGYAADVDFEEGLRRLTATPI